MKRIVFFILLFYSGAFCQTTKIGGVSLPWSVATGGTGLATLTSNSLLVGNGTSAVTLLAAGTDGYVLTMVSGSPAWAAAGGGGGSSKYDIYFSEPQLSFSFGYYCITAGVDYFGTFPVSTDPTGGGSGNIGYATRMRGSGTIKNFEFTIGTAPGGVKTFTMTFIKNGSSQTLAATCTGSATTASDNSDSFTYADGDLVALLSSGSSGTCYTTIALTVEVDPN